MDDQARIPPPNYTQIPNVILDLMPEMNESEFRVIVAIARQTFGWHKKRDKISLSQLVKLTGLSKQSVVNGIEAGEKRGLIERTPDESDKRGGIWYRLLVKPLDQSNQLTSQEADQSNDLTRTSPTIRPELVQPLDTQKKEKEKKEREGDERTPPPALDRHPAVALYQSLSGRKATKVQAEMIAAQVVDVSRWGATVKRWLASDYKPGNVNGMLDWYHGKGRHQGGTQVERKPADLPLVTATSVSQTPEERRQAAERRRQIMEETRTRNAS